jgi:hypothetical protein
MLRVRDSVGQYFDATIAQLARPGPMQAERALHDIGGPHWQVFGGPADRIARPPLMVKTILMTAGPGWRYGAVRLRSLRVRTRLRQEEGLRLRAAPEPGLDGFALTVENLLPVASGITLAYGVVGLDGVEVTRGARRLVLPGGGQTSHHIPVAGSTAPPAPPVVQLAAQASGQGAVEEAQASLVRSTTVRAAAPLAGMGVHAGLSTRVLPREMARLAGQIAACGVPWIREDFNWQQISQVKDRVSVRRHDQAIAAATAAGVRVLGLPTDWPFWTSPYSARGVRDFTSFLRTVATRYRGRVAAWEIWNEPNLPSSWRGTPGQYVELLAAAYATLKEIDPAVLVVGPCTAGPGDLTTPASLRALGWIERVLAAPGPLFDVFSFHPYEGRRSPEQADLTQTVGHLHGLLRASGHPPRIWITEQGWASADPLLGIDELQQARFLVRAYLLSRLGGVEAYFWYDARNDGLSPDDREDNFGLLRRDFLAKAAYRALAVLAEVLGDRSLVGVLVTPPGVLAVRFASAGAQPPVLAVWAQPHPAVVAITPTDQGGTIRDLDGRVSPLPTGGAQVRLPAGLVRFVVGDAVLSSASR